MGAEQYPKMYLYKRIVDAKLFIDKHYAEHIDLSNIADEACFSKFHFIRLFREVYGKTPHNYLTQVRVDNAQLLLSKNIPVSEVSFLVGFDSSTSFAAIFKKHAGMSPSIYQRRQLLKRALHVDKPLTAIPNCFAETFGWKKAISNS